jgi:hypothetical protein
MRGFLCLLLCLSCVSCASIERLFRNSPLRGMEPDAERVNLWPLYYESGGKTAVLWPVFDEDEKGFALRPLITRDGTRWEVLPPLCFWDTESGDWVFLPAYSIDDSFGVFPLFGSGWLNHVGPIWWDFDDEGKLDRGGLFPLARLGSGLKHIGPIWWKHRAGEGEEEDSTSWGIFPLIDVSKSFMNIGSLFWGFRPDGETKYMVAFPLFGYGNGEDGGGMFLSLLGGRGWDKSGDTTFVNVLGPVFHYGTSKESFEMSALWPLFSMSSSPNRSSWLVWPLYGSSTTRIPKDDVDLSETTALSGLFHHAKLGEKTTGLRMLPLFGYRSADGGLEDPIDHLSLYGHKEYGPDSTGIHIATPMVFNYRSSKNGYRWSSLLGILDYETEGENSEFRFLYYLYREKTEGTETQRDFFPFFKWDSGEKRSSFSFLWRLFNWERNGDKVGGHIFFIPWGEV